MHVPNVRRLQLERGSDKRCFCFRLLTIYRSIVLEMFSHCADLFRSVSTGLAMLIDFIYTRSLGCDSISNLRLEKTSPGATLFIVGIKMLKRSWRRVVQRHPQLESPYFTIS